MATFTIERSDIQTVIDLGIFDLADENNEGSDVWVAKNEAGEVVGFAQAELSANTIYMLESREQGCGRALVEYLLDGEETMIADNVVKGCEGFWTAMGFKPVARFLGVDWRWTAEIEA